MYKLPIHIVILESSKIIYEGLHSILSQSDMDCRIYRIEKLDDLHDLFKTETIDIIIANPLHFVNREKEINRIRKDYNAIALVGIDFGMMQRPTIEQDASFTLYDSPEHIVQLLSKLNSKNRSTIKKKDKGENLTKREMEVLTEIVNGKLNKEIAETLDISIHTVVRHRKNITMKTGIRSQSGLTIYAITKNIVSLEDIDI